MQTLRIFYYILIFMFTLRNKTNAEEHRTQNKSCTIGFGIVDDCVIDNTLSDHVSSPDVKHNELGSEEYYYIIVKNDDLDDAVRSNVSSHDLLDSETDTNTGSRESVERIETDELYTTEIPTETDEPTTATTEATTTEASSEETDEPTTVTTEATTTEASSEETDETTTVTTEATTTEASSEETDEPTTVTTEATTTEASSEETNTETTAPISTTPTPEDKIDQILEDIHEILQNGTDLTIDDISDVFEQVNDLLDINDDVTFPGELLDLLDTLGSKIQLNGEPNGTVIGENLALLMADASSDNPVKGLRLKDGSSGTRNSFVKDSFEFLSDDDNSNHLDADLSEAIVYLPDSVANSTRRISFVVFRDGQAFDHKNPHVFVNSRVLSVNVENLTQFDQNEVVTIHLKPSRTPERSMNRSCGYWIFLDENTGYWSQEGCTFIQSSNLALLDTCKCNSLGRFAEIFTLRPTFSKSNENALKAISITGSSLSIIGAIFIVLTAMLFNSWRTNFANQIWLQLNIALFILSVCFLVVVSVRYVEYSVSCLLTGIVLHYSVVATFCWILVAVIKAYRDSVVPLSSRISHKMSIASGFSWGTPIVLIAIYLLVAKEPYVGRFEDMTPSGSFCYPSGIGLWLSVYTPMAIVLLVNVILFFYIVGFASRSTHIQNVEHAHKAIRYARVGFALVIIFGLAWIFGLFAYNIVAAYIFTITVTLKCFILFLFIVCGDKETRELWLCKLNLKPGPTHQYSRRFTPPY
ncbi:adhesion G-protein coupled receptor G2-like [Galleria mellonella]|uniref:Adhesion G-protein coupled receptor G2-like n=1 Tax=Galleria mellonella TaxID=7137 RepID=A0ABM3MJZ5_GALME|nr:adhesion G-protein coupled receptor G2-like [Galleria mellonella]